MKRAPIKLAPLGLFGEQLSFLPPVPFSPVWPKRGTLAELCLRMLMAGKLIDHPGFERDTKSWRLGAVIFSLRSVGWSVESLRVPAPTEIMPNRTIAIYKLDEKEMALALAAQNSGRENGKA